MSSSIAYSSRARWCPSRSLLGHVLRLRVKNQKQAEAWYLITIFSVIILLIVMQFLSWSLWHEEIASNHKIALWYWFGQLGAVGLVFFGGLIGYCPRVSIELAGSHLSVSQGQRSVKVNLDSLIDCKIVSALRYYRDWDRRAERYMTHIPDDVLLVFTEREITAIGINPDAHAELIVAINHFDSVEAEVVHAV